MENSVDSAKVKSQKNVNGAGSNGADSIEAKCTWHSLDAGEVLAKLKTNSDVGLADKEARERLSQYGPNSLPKPVPRSLLSIFMQQFLSPLIYILIVAAVIAFFMGEVSDALVICVVVIVNAIVGAFQEGRAEQSLAQLRKLSELKSRILRNGRELVLTAIYIVPGDIMLLGAGDAVPADARIIEAAALKVSEAALTGEALSIPKLSSTLQEEAALPDRANMLYAGTHIVDGRALAVVVATGQNTEIGKIAHLTSTTEGQETQLQIRIQQLGKHLVVAAVVMFVLVIGIGLFKDIPFSQIFMIAISQMVSLVPEGMPVAITIALAVGVQRMAKRGTIIRRLGAVEALGSTTIICTDKTGTLTRNEMAVVSVYLVGQDQEIRVTGTGYSPEGTFINEKEQLQLNDPGQTADGAERKKPNNPDFDSLVAICALCNDAQLVEPGKDNSEWEILGDPTEAALLTLAAKAGVDIKELRSRSPRLAELPFNSDDQMMATEHTWNGEPTIFIKGAPERVLEFCESFLRMGQVEQSFESVKDRTVEQANKMADAALRVLAIGLIKKSQIDPKLGFSALSGKITLVGLVGEMDPPRENVAASVAECKAAGIKPVMITGDHKVTGCAIAMALGISTTQDHTLEGSEISQLSNESLLSKIDSVSVFARVHPEQKLRIVDCYQQLGHVVAMTGDGVNDAPALARADIGVAMGITGTEVAKEAAKIVITDDNFATIVRAIAEGRLVYSNIKKLILFLIVTSVDEVAVLFLALLLGYPLPLAAVQILWINLVTEGALTINLIMEPSEGDEMTRPPVPTKQPLMDRELLMRIPLMVLASVASTFGWFAFRHSEGISYDLLRTETFTMLAVCQWFNVLNCRSAIHSAISKSILNNLWLIAGLALGIVLQLAVIYWHPLGQFFHTVPIESFHLFLIVAVASLALWTEEIRKWIVRSRKQ